MTGPEVERPGDWEPTDDDWREADEWSARDDRPLVHWPAWAYWASIAVGVACAATAVALLIAWVTGPAVNP